MYNFQLIGFSNFSNVFYGLCIDGKTFFNFFFSLIYGCIGSAINNYFNPVFLYKILKGRFVANIQFINIGKNIVKVWKAFCGFLKFVAQLSFAAGYENSLHKKYLL
jgi:hypothetical protein